MSQFKNSDDYVVELGFGHLREAFWSLRLLWLALPVLLIISTILIDKLLPDEYEATTVLAPSEERGAGLSDMLGGLSGLSNLAGINLGGQKLNNTQLAVELLKSRSFLYKVIEKYNMHEPLVGAKGMNENGQLIIDKDEVRERPEVWHAYNELKDRYVVNYDRAAGIVSINIKFYSAKVAAQWLEYIVLEINAVMREREREQIVNSIDYLTTKAQEADIAEVRAAIYNLLQEQYKQAMLIAVNKDHVFETIDPPFVPHTPAGLPLTLKLIVGIIVSVFFMLIVTLFAGYRRARHTP